MIEQTSIAKGLREIIPAILAGSHSRTDLNRLIAVSHSLAASFLASKATTESLISVYDLTTSDLAYDCIADLFQEDGDGRYGQLQAYFAGLSISTSRDEEILHPSPAACFFEGEPEYLPAIQRGRSIIVENSPEH